MHNETQEENNSIDKCINTDPLIDIESDLSIDYEEDEDNETENQ